MGNDIDRRILNVMTSVFDTSLDKKQDNISTETVESWDSLKHIQLIVAFEKELGIKIKTSDVEKLTSYKKIIKYLL